MIFPKFWGNPGQSICLKKWRLLIDNRGSKLPKFRDKSGAREEAGNVVEMGHFNSTLSSEMGPRQKCQISQDFYRNFGGILAIRLSPKMALL